MYNNEELKQLINHVKKCPYQVPAGVRKPLESKCDGSSAKSWSTPPVKNVYYLVRDNAGKPLSLLRYDGKKYYCVAGVNNPEYVQGNKPNTNTEYCFEPVAAFASSPIVSEWLSILGAVVSPTKRLSESKRKSENKLKASTEEWEQTKERVVGLLHNGVKTKHIIELTGVSKATISRLRQTIQ